MIVRVKMKVNHHPSFGRMGGITIVIVSRSLDWSTEVCWIQIQRTTDDGQGEASNDQPRSLTRIGHQLMFVITCERVRETKQAVG